MNRTALFLAMTTMASAICVSSCKTDKSPNGQQAAALYSPADKPKYAAAKYELPATGKGASGQLLERRGYTTSYNATTRNPNWVAWHLTRGHTNGSCQRTGILFTEDLSVKEPRATNNDYYNSRYDRGHMCPAGNNKWDATAMNESFLFTNICPQNHGLNKYEWNDVEQLCRSWARKYDAVDIVCGPVYTDTKTPKTIGRNRVRVPDAFFKVVLRRGQQPCAIGFLFSNEGRKQPLREAVRTVDEIEKLTGYDFFHLLDNRTEQCIEAHASLSEW